MTLEDFESTEAISGIVFGVELDTVKDSSPGDSSKENVVDVETRCSSAGVVVLGGGSRKGVVDLVEFIRGSRFVAKVGRIGVRSGLYAL